MVRPEAIAALLAQLPELLEEGRLAGHDVDSDPFLTLDPEGLVERYLIAANGNVANAAKRLRATIAWRRDAGVLSWHKPGAAERLLLEKNCPGAEVYFADSGHVDRQGRPYLVGRLGLFSKANMNPLRHFQGNFFVIERIVLEVLRRRCRSFTYIIEIGGLDHLEDGGSVCGTGGSKRNRSATKEQREVCEVAAPFSRQFGEMPGGLPVTQAGLADFYAHYPCFLEHVSFVKSGPIFSTLFRIFSLWVPARFRKFHFFGGWLNPPLKSLQEMYAPDQLPTEFGGSGWSLNGEEFLQRAVRAYSSAGREASASAEAPEPKGAGSEEVQPPEEPGTTARASLRGHSGRQALGQARACLVRRRSTRRNLRARASRAVLAVAVLPLLPMPLMRSTSRAEKLELSSAGLGHEVPLLGEGTAALSRTWRPRPVAASQPTAGI
mmetsp:Transcript_26627/g.58485  ORF Transcript_26627/g.58485 Transcript_26627/m.58485 type:complete len:436 (-) Transcript_26627:17-1324(-)